MKLVVIFIIGIVACQDMFAEYKAKMINQLNSVRFNVKVNTLNARALQMRILCLSNPRLICYYLIN